MRQRKVKNLEERLAVCSAYMVQEATGKKGSWKSLFGNHQPLYMELGCGKGQFVIKQATLHPERNFIAVEGHDTVLLRALEKAVEAGLPNLKFIRGYIQDVNDYFAENELDGIYLNFSDPWPKDRHEKRRLTHERFLAGYQTVIKDSGTVEFKTDNNELFEFSIDEIKAQNYEIVEYSRDLHNSAFSAKQVTTEYEDKFSRQNKCINYVKFVV